MQTLNVHAFYIQTYLYFVEKKHKLNWPGPECHLSCPSLHRDTVVPFSHLVAYPISHRIHKKCSFALLYSTLAPCCTGLKVTFHWRKLKFFYSKPDVKFSTASPGSRSVSFIHECIFGRFSVGMVPSACRTGLATPGNTNKQLIDIATVMKSKRNHMIRERNSYHEAVRFVFLRTSVYSGEQKFYGIRSLTRTPLVHRTVIKLGCTFTKRYMLPETFAIFTFWTMDNLHYSCSFI